MVCHFNIPTLNHAMRYSTLLTLTSFIGLTSLVVLPTISGQTLAPVRRLPLNEPLETSKNMPPAPPRKIETSPRMISQFGVFTSYQANVDASGNNILGDAANEPAIAVDPTDSNKMTIGWRQFDSINPTSGKAAGVIQPMPVCIGLSQVFWNPEFFAAIL